MAPCLLLILMLLLRCFNLLICFDCSFVCVDQEGYTKETVTTVHGKLTSHDIVPFGHFRDEQYLYHSIFPRRLCNI